MSETHAEIVASGVAAAVESAVADADQRAEHVAANADAVAEAAISHAADRIAEAERAAAQLAEAALATNMGQRMDALHGDLQQCLNGLAEANRELASFRSEISAIQATVAQSMMPLITLEPSTPQISAPPLEPLTEMLPEAVSVVEESPEPVTQPRRPQRRLL
jgi:chromosome segregation ATPase